MKIDYRSAIVPALIACSFFAHAKTPSDPFGAEYRKDQQAYYDAESKYRQPVHDAKTPEERAKVHLDLKLSPALRFLPKFQLLAKKAGRTPTGFDANEMTVVCGVEIKNFAAVNHAMTMLVGRFIDSPKAGRLVDYLIDYVEREEKNPTGRRLVVGWRVKVEKSHNPEILAALLLRSGYMADPDGRGDPTKAKKLYKEVVARYPKTDYAQVASKQLDELFHLDVNMPAPDFSAEDQYGASFRLSDYKGKVVMLDFWGFWCSYCRQMLPYNRDLVDTYKGKPFALVGVNSSLGQPVQKKIIEEISYRNAVGSTADAISKAWNVESWPTVYLIDQNGNIAYKSHDPDPKILSKHIDDLVNKAMKG